MTTCLWRADRGIKCRKCSKSVWVWFVWLLVFGVLWSLALDFEFFSGKLHLVPHIWLCPALPVCVHLHSSASPLHLLSSQTSSVRMPGTELCAEKAKRGGCPVPGDTVVSMVGKEKKSRIKYSMTTCSDRHTPTVDLGRAWDAQHSPSWVLKDD